ncbi:MAG: hypothetical protein COX43_02140 [Parcubacteria group bacterium CG23_combo_of_CG06-09_8_20_14_all_35_9]|nr:MAG: hypothetical protein COX43_02140 [Parcubacteria group bacterium CG23_combo_of_CG06-09_8_20_14_all_35_9]
MIKHKEQRVGVFVDVQNMYHSAKNLYKTKVNFKEVLKVAVAGRKLIRALAYVIKSQSSEEQNFFEALDKQGFEIRIKDLQIFAGGAKKGDWDVGIAIDMIKMSENVDVLILVSGDGDFTPVVEYIQNHGRLVEILAFKETTSAKLIERADDFTNLSQNKQKFLLGYLTQKR